MLGIGVAGQIARISDSPETAVKRHCMAELIPWRCSAERSYWQYNTGYGCLLPKTLSEA